MGYIFGNTKVREVMSRGIFTVKFYERASVAVSIMANHNISAVVAVDGQNEAMGVVSSVDIIGAIKRHTPSEFRELTVEDIMSPNIVHISPTDSIEKAAEMMGEYNIHRLIVLHPAEFGGTKPVGLLSSTDLVKLLEKELRTGYVKAYE